MTPWVHEFIFGLPNNATNRERMRRIGYAVYTEGLTMQQRHDIVDGTLPYDPNSPQVNNFNRIWVTQALNEFVIGSAPLKDAHWDWLDDRLANNPITNMRYGRLETENGTDFLLTEDHNVPALNPFIDTIQTPASCLAIIGLTPKKTS